MSDNDIVAKTALELIANGDTTQIETSTADLDRTKTQMNIFLIEQAKKELKTIVKYTLLLDKLQDKYINEIENNIINSEGDEYFDTLPIFIDHISKCIDRSSKLLRDILGNDKIMNILFVDMSSSKTINNNNSTNILNLSDPQSRQRVRSSVEKIMAQIDKVENIEGQEEA